MPVVEFVYENQVSHGYSDPNHSSFDTSKCESATQRIVLMHETSSENSVVVSSALNVTKSPWQHKAILRHRLLLRQKASFYTHFHCRVAEKFTYLLFLEENAIQSLEASGVSAQGVDYLSLGKLKSIRRLQRDKSFRYNSAISVTSVLVRLCASTRAVSIKMQAYGMPMSWRNGRRCPRCRYCLSH